jgi:hypothetical protein
MIVDIFDRINKAFLLDIDRSGPKLAFPSHFLLVRSPLMDILPFLPEPVLDSICNPAYIPFFIQSINGILSTRYLSRRILFVTSTVVPSSFINFYLDVSIVVSFTNLQSIRMKIKLINNPNELAIIGWEIVDEVPFGTVATHYQEFHVDIPIDKSFIAESPSPPFNMNKLKTKRRRDDPDDEWDDEQDCRKYLNTAVPTLFFE